MMRGGSPPAVDTDSANGRHRPAEGTTMVSGLLRSDDTYWCADALRRLV